MMYPDSYMTGAWGPWMFLGVILCLALIALLTVVLIRALGPSRPVSTDAKRILEARLARGEIDAQQYRERLALLAE